MKVHAAGCDMQTASITELNELLITLNAFLYKTEAFQTLLALPSLASAVSEAIKAAEQERKLQQPEVTFDVHWLDDELNPDDPATSPVLRYCKAVLAWMRAGMSLSRSKLLRGPLPKLHVVRSYVSMDNTPMMNLRNLMRDTILPRVGYFSRVGNEALIQQLLDREDFVNSGDFTGKVHCGAKFMVLVNSCTPTTSPATVLPFSKARTQDLMPLFSNPDRVLGLGKKPCFCCYLLARLFRDAFLVPETHGIPFPWTPPGFGIPVSMLELLEERLVQKLIRLTEEWIASHFIPPTRSREYDSDDAELDDFPVWTSTDVENT